MNDSQAMLSRVADSVYWMSRYLERSENTARLIDVHINSMLDMNLDSIKTQRLQRLEETLSMGIPTEIDLEQADLLYELTFNQAQSISIVSTVMSARENARQIREQISSEMWTQINKLYLLVMGADSGTIWETNLHSFYVQVREGSHLFQGITDATMNHNQGWHFIQLGRYVERSLSLLQLLDVHFRDTHLESQQNIEPNTYFEMVTILKSVSAFEAYCKVYNPNLQSLLIVEFLLFNQDFPRSLRFCVEMIQH